MFKSQLRNIYIKIKNCQSNHFGKGVYFDKTIVIGKNCKVGNYSEISQHSIIHDNVIIGNYASLSKIEIGENSHIEYGVVCTGFGNGKIIIGKDCYIGIRNILDWSDNIIIGNNVHIAGSSTGLWTHSSVQQVLNGDKLNDKSKRTTAPITIEDNVYIGGNCTIYPGVKISHHSVVAPNSAVTNDVEPYTMVGGVPAKLIKKLNS
jgi:acetyltransferase-like isoleucine patch superfamily enzyme